MDGVTLEFVQGKILDAIQKLDDALAAQKKAAEQRARTTHEYRKLKAEAYLFAQADRDTNKSKRTVDWIIAYVDARCEKEMLKRNLADAEHEAACQLVMSLRTQVSAFQSILRSYTAEAEAVAYGQSVSA